MFLDRFPPLYGFATLPESSSMAWLRPRPQHAQPRVIQNAGRLVAANTQGLSINFGRIIPKGWALACPFAGYAFSITTRLSSILATSSSRGFKGKALSLTNSLGRLMLCLPPET